MSTSRSWKLLLHQYATHGTICLALQSAFLGMYSPIDLEGGILVKMPSSIR